VTIGGVERRLAAVLAADVAGYSRLMGADEVGTLEALKTYRREVVDPAIAEYNGRIVKTTGDGMLVEFASAVAAVNCAIMVQERMAARDQDSVRQIAFRIGINVGDIIIDGGDIFGDGVNIAARVEGECEPGGVCLSASAFEQVRGKTNFAFEDLGERSLKNIDRPVRLYAARPASSSQGGDVRSAAGTAARQLALPDKPSIAVLPFQNMSGDPEQEYFADGMVEDIITALSRFKSLFVIARNSSFTYKGKAVDIKKVGEELGVRYVLEGSVRKSGNRVRITGQLIDAENGAHIWADRFDGNLEDAFDLQDRITSSTVGAIAPKLQTSEFERLKRKPTDNPSAYDSYLRGLAQMYQFKKESLQQAIELFQTAIAIDNQYASPYAAEAFTYAVRQTFGWGLATAEEKVRVRTLANRASELDKDDAVSLTYAGYALVLLCHDLDDGAEFLERAVVANPNLAIAWTYRGHTSLHLGDPEKAIDYFKTALRLSPLDPLDFATQKGLADAYFFSGQYTDALKWALSAIRASPNWVPARLTAMCSHALLGDIEAAKAMGQIAMQIDPTRRISAMRQRYPLRREQDFARLMEAYRVAGIPE
jgi:TolB-like protein/class 3 adenylate cyclase